MNNLKAFAMKPCFREIGLAENLIQASKVICVIGYNANHKEIKSVILTTFTS